MKKLLCVICLASSNVFAHGLYPSRIESDSGSKVIGYRFTATNNYKTADRFEVECFKGIRYDQKIDCIAIPDRFILVAGGRKTFKVQIETEGDGIYLVCTKEIPYEHKTVITRVCARWGVGVSVATPNVPTANGNRQRQSTN